MTIDIRKAVKGCVLGAAVGDAIGLPVEGMTRVRQARMKPFIGGHSFLFSKGMLSDDTEHTLMVARAMAATASDPELFRKSLARQLKWWVAMLPAGVGPATLRAGLKLWMGYSPRTSGVFSAGNGPAMRSAIIGAAMANDQQRMTRLVEASTLITHTDPKALCGALAVAQMAAISARKEKMDPEKFITRLWGIFDSYDAQGFTKDTAQVSKSLVEFMELATKAAHSAGEEQTLAKYLFNSGDQHGVGAYVFHTVPAVIQCWLRRQEDLEGAVLEMVRAGGDTDTSASIIGGIIGARTGEEGIPSAWIEGLADWPRTTEWMRKVADTLAESVESGESKDPPGLNPVAVAIRNAFFMAVVLAHGLRRVAPPY